MTAGRRDQLATALRALADATEAMTCDDGDPVDCPKCSQPVQVFSTVGGKVDTIFAEVDPLADALLPVVDRMIRQAQADALESAARVLHAVPPRDRAFPAVAGVGDWLRDRAAALRAPASGTDQPLGDETTPAGTSTAPGTSDTAERHRGRHEKRLGDHAPAATT